MRFHHERVLSGRGNDQDQFLQSLTGIAVGREDLLYVTGDAAVKVFHSNGDFSHGWSLEKAGLSLGIDDRTVYVGEIGQIEVFDSRGQLLTGWKDPELLGRVTAIGVLEDSIIVADAGARCLRRFDRERRFLHNIGDSNRMRGFNIPNGTLDFAVDGEGVIHACNPGKHRVERYTSAGELLGHIGRFDGRDPEGFPGCCNPTNVTVTEEKLIFVTEKAGPRAKVLDFEGKLISVISASDFDLNCKNMDVAVDSRGWVYVVDTVKLQINVFRPEYVGQR